MFPFIYLSLLPHQLIFLNQIVVYYTQQGPVSPTVSTPQSLSPQHRENGNVEKRARPSALRIVDPDTSTDVLTGEKVVPSEMTTLPMTPPPDFPSTPTSESRMAEKEFCTSIKNNFFCYFLSSKI